MQSLVVSVSDLTWDSDDHKNAMLGHMLIYFAIYGTLGMEIRYSQSISLLACGHDPHTINHLIHNHGVDLHPQTRHR
ncbi:hypothetical protein CVT25_012981 [Psilocybe cyanescens]|uniref:Uncharacterized protein n=1 Tax=Psilocybe cyanescens TaxID=93625 RepID=A0A409X7K4_PSICY|nr:hypothetical protein CVT25_012981 [Psilocybe cyanescens]